MKKATNQLRAKTQGDIPAPMTLEYISSNDKHMAELKEEVALVKQAVSNLTENTKCDKLENSTQHTVIITGQEKIITKIDGLKEEFATAEEFHFWRNVLIAGILLAIFIGILSIMLDKFSR